VKGWHFLLVLSLVVAVILAPFASQWPDGLERVAEELHFADAAAANPLVHSPLPDYAIPGLQNAQLSTALAGLVGTFLVLLVLFGLGKLLAPKQTND